MFEKAKDPEVIAKKISHKPIEYEKLNSLTDDFGKRFSPQQELSVEQAFWFHTLSPTIEPSYTPPVIVDVPSELPNVSLVNASLKKLKFHLTQFDSMVKKRTTHSAPEEGTREVYIDYLRNTQEQDNILWEIVEQAKAKQPLDSELDLACKYATRIQELLVYVQDTCPNAITPSAKKVTVKPMNNVKKVRFAEPLTSSSKIQWVESSNTSDSDTSVLNKKNKVEAQPRKVNRVVKPVCDVDVKHSLSNANSKILCATCNKSVFDGVHDKCLLDHIVLWYLDSGCSKRMTGNHSQLMNFVSKFLGTVRFENDQIARIMGYGDCHLGNVIISRVYYVEGLGHNLFSVGQFCDADLEVAFRKNTCFISNLKGVDLLSGSRDTNLYTISLDDMLKSSLICLLSKASKTKSWLWHR
ncbi:hypothetical protein Tco_1426402 [Tanacetum coccineum]